MKLVKKVLAVALTGAMALSMFAACDTSTLSEDEFVAAVNSNLSTYTNAEGTSVEYDLGYSAEATALAIAYGAVTGAIEEGSEELPKDKTSAEYDATLARIEKVGDYSYPTTALYVVGTFTSTKDVTSIASGVAAEVEELQKAFVSNIKAIDADVEGKVDGVETAGPVGYAETPYDTPRYINDYLYIRDYSTTSTNERAIYPTVNTNTKGSVDYDSTKNDANKVKNVYKIYVGATVDSIGYYYDPSEIDDDSTTMTVYVVFGISCTGISLNAQTVNNAFYYTEGGKEYLNNSKIDSLIDPNSDEYVGTENVIG